VIVTDGPLVPEETWPFYNQRACCENFIKEGIYGLGLDKVISHSYRGNYAYFELLMLGYNLMNFFRGIQPGESQAHNADGSAEVFPGGRAFDSDGERMDLEVRAGLVLPEGVGESARSSDLTSVEV
jgi:hypothetical protein